MMTARSDVRLAGRVALVTGGSSGIGRATCVALARAGAGVVVLGRDGVRVAETVERAREAARGSEAEAGVLGIADTDVRDEQHVACAVKRALDHFAAIDVLVASAGIGRSRAGGALGACPVSRLPVESWCDVIDTNLKSVFLSARAVAPSMIARGGGDIVCISSARAARSGQPYAAAYSASKFGLTGLVDVLAQELEPHGVRVQMLVPDAVDTPLIHGTSLASGGALHPSVVARAIVELIALPDDVRWVDPLLEPWTAAEPAARAVVNGAR